MLSLLHIENVAVIEKADIEFKDGFNVLTGETGAGKSILIDAIGAALGERTSRDIIRTGASYSQISAVFIRPSDSVTELLAQNGLSAEEDSIIIHREIYPDGRNVCRVNGRPVTVAFLKELGPALINIHGQHDSGKLLNEEFHITYVDGFGKNETLLSEYSGAYSELMRLKKEIESLNIDENEKNRKIETLTYQIEELENAGLKAGEDEELYARQKILQNSDKVIKCLEDSYYALYGGEDLPGVSELISDSIHALSGISHLNGDIDALLQRLYDLKYLADDVSSELRDMRGGFEYSPGEIEAVQARLDIIYKLKRKYGNTTEEMLSYLEKCKNELEQIELSGDMLIKLTEKYEEQYKKTIEISKRLTEARKKAALLLEKRILKELNELDMTRAAFKAEFYDSQPEPGPNGQDKIKFLISMNAGEILKPMSKIASGGELARIMLALKNVLAENDDVCTLIFDEVDSGVSGRAAQKVAHKLKAVSKIKQVLCITHLPQIASAADTHFKIEKDEEKGRTFTKISVLSYEDRKKELARIIGGASITDAILKSAEELLSQNKI